MTIGEIYDKIQKIKQLETIRNAYLEACLKSKTLSKEDLNYISEHKNIRAPKKNSNARPFYEEINKINDEIAYLRKEKVHIDRINVNDD